MKIESRDNAMAVIFDNGSELLLSYEGARKLRKLLNDAVAMNESASQGLQKASPEGEGREANYEHLYNLVMSLLRQSKKPHGLCEPRERQACTHCNAVDALDAMLAQYKGARIIPSTLTEALRQSAAPSGVDLREARNSRWRNVMQAGVYRHYKGGLYQVIGVGQNSETDELVVVYISLTGANLPGPRIRVRPLTGRGGWETTENGKERFTYVGDSPEGANAALAQESKTGAVTDASTSGNSFGPSQGNHERGIHESSSPSSTGAVTETK